MTISEVSDMGEGNWILLRCPTGQTFGPDRDGHRFLHASEGAGSWPSPIGDGSGGGHLAPVSPGGDLTGPNPTDRGKRGTKYHIAGDGVPVACAATAANVNDTLVFERLFLTAFAVMTRIRTVFADKGYDAEHHRDLCREFGAEPCIHKRGQPHGSGLG